MTTTAATAALDEIRSLCSAAEELAEAGIQYIYLPDLKLPCAPGLVDGLLALQQHGGYTTRLFLSVPVVGKGANWTVHQILGRTWHSWSWNNVPATLRPIEILVNHLDALR